MGDRGVREGAEGWRVRGKRRRAGGGGRSTKTGGREGGCGGRQLRCRAIPPTQCNGRSGGSLGSPWRDVGDPIGAFPGFLEPCLGDLAPL